MKSFISLIAVFILTYFGSQLIWWLPAILCFVLFFVVESSPLMAFGSGLFGGGFSWVAGAAISDATANVKISGLLASLFGGVPISAVYFLVFLTIGLLCGMASLSGTLLKRVTS